MIMTTEEEQKEKKEKEKTRREKLGGYFYDLSKLIFAGLVLGGLSPIFSGNSIGGNWVSILLGSVTTFVSAFFANRILKH